MMKAKYRLYIKLAVDLVMAVLLLIVMGYHTLTNEVHEIIGVTIFCLFILHLALNYKWFLTLFKGKYNSSRIISLVLNLALIVFMTLTIVSSFMISMNLFRDIQFGSLSLGRSLHQVCTAWTFIVVAMHIGTHVLLIDRALFGKIKHTKVLLWIVRVLFIVISIYGIYAFIDRRLYDSLFHLVMFVYLPYGEQMIISLLNNLSIMITFATGTYYLSRLISIIIKKHKNKEADAK